ncbi:MAG: GHMP kinase [Clostridiales Family XIII bacterium]|jgi:D-glycero-alpha-D-manno-heptose-7-phosphate kinase|nr:GHMP kinase [Clostridiales Family XIII bacterium]
MIIVKTPLRVSFCGGGSDLPAFYEKHGGAVLSAGLGRYVYLSIHPYFHADRLVCKYSKTEIVAKASKLKHPIFRVLLERFGINGAEITSTADVPAGTGLGSSSSFTVGLLHTLYAYTGKYVSRGRLAEEACRTEIDTLGEPIGKQDQYAAAFGGLHVFRFRKDGLTEAEPVLLSSEAAARMERNLLMFYTGDLRSASAILAEQGKNVRENAEKEKAQLAILAMTDELHRELTRDNIDALGPILHASWREKRKLASGIATPPIDEAYEKALSAGATGGKLLGAGGGGFLLFYVPEHRHADVKNALSHLKYMEFGFSPGGSTVIYVGEKPKGH